MENLDVFGSSKQQSQSQSQPQPQPQPQSQRLVDVQVTNQNEALNLLVSFLNLAQKRGCYNIDESAKIWECIKYFQL